MIKNKIISLSLVVVLLSSTSSAEVIADLFTTTNMNEPSSWTDPRTGVNYKNFGSKTFKFDNANVKFTPWLKFKAPSINADCNSISMDAGYVAFLDLDEIGGQLEKAISSAGMGVIVGLLQTLPTIGKAFENIQKLIRKIQGMLQNSCQMASALIKDAASKEYKKHMTNQVDKANGPKAQLKKQQGGASFMEDMKKFIECKDSTPKCLKNAFRDNVALISNAKQNSRNISMNSKFAQAVVASKATKNDLDKHYFGTLEKLLDNDFHGKALNISSLDIKKFKLTMAMFGVLYVENKDAEKLIASAITKPIASDVKLLIDKNLEEDPSSSFALKHLEPKASDQEVFEFLSGDINGTEHKLKYDKKFKINLIATSTDHLTEDVEEKGEYKTIVWLERESGVTPAYSEIAWEGIYQSTYKSIMHSLDPNAYNAPTISTPPYMPKGSYYVTMIKEHANRKEWAMYADLLSKINIRYAIRGLMEDAKAEVFKLTFDGSSKANMETYKLFIKYIESRTRRIEALVELNPNEVLFLNNTQQIFDNMIRISRESKRFKGIR